MNCPCAPPGASTVSVPGVHRVANGDLLANAVKISARRRTRGRLRRRERYEERISWTMSSIPSPMPSSPVPVTSAREAFARVYNGAMWRFKPGQPRSGGGSTLQATNTTCAVLLTAVRLVAQRQSTVRILDTPCGDGTWMPNCLTQIASSDVSSIQIEYQGVDVVPSLVAQLNARRGHLLTSPGFAVPSMRVRVLPFACADIANWTEMRRFSSSFWQPDIILSKHFLMHIPNAHVLRALSVWDRLGAKLLVKDNTPTSRGKVRDTVMAGDHAVDIHAGPFNIGAPLCQSWDAGLCAAERKCDDRIEIIPLPLRRIMAAGERAPTVSHRQSTMANVASCLVDRIHYDDMADVEPLYKW